MGVFDFFLGFDAIEEAINTKRQASQQYEEVSNGLRQIMSLFSNGGFLGENGNHMMQLLQRDNQVVSQFADVMGDGSSRLRRTLDQVMEASESLQSLMPF